MLLLLKGHKSKKGKDVGATSLVPGQFLDRALTWEDQVKLCKDHDNMDLALDIYRNRIAELNKLGTDANKWGDMKPADLEKEQGVHKLHKITDVPDMWQHQFRMYSDCKGMPVVQDTVELCMSIEKGVQPSCATIERAEWVLPDIKVTKEELALRRRLRDILKAAAVADGEQINVNRRGTEPPQRQYVFGQTALVFVQKEDGNLKQVHPDEEQRYWVWKWVPHKLGIDSEVGEYLILDEVENEVKSSPADLLWPNTDSTAKPEKSELAKLVSWDDMWDWSITGVRQLWEDVNTVADSKACIQQRKFVLDGMVHQELWEKDGRSYVLFWVFLRKRAGESQGGSLIKELMLTPLRFDDDPGAFQVALDARRDVQRRAPWPTRLASEMLIAINPDTLQSMRAGPMKLSMQQMMSVAEREFTDGDDGVTHEQLIKQVHEELGAIHRGQVAREALEDLQAGQGETPKRPARWAKHTEEEEKPKPKPPTGGGASLGRGGRGLGRGGRGGACGGAGRGTGGEREPGTKRVCLYEAVQKGSCPSKMIAGSDMNVTMKNELK